MFQRFGIIHNNCPTGTCDNTKGQLVKQQYRT